MGGNDDVLSAIKGLEDENKKRHDEVLQKFGGMEVKLDKLDKRLSSAEVKIRLVDEEVSKLKGEINELKQRDLQFNLIIKNIPELKDETQQFIAHVVHSLLKLLKIEGYESKISGARRIGKNNSTSGRPILVVLNDLDTKQKIIAAKRKTSLNLSQIIIGEQALGVETDLIYIDEQLTAYSGMLFKEARAIKKSGLVKFAWTSHGRIYLKQHENAVPIYVRNMTDIITSKPLFKKRKNDDQQPTGSNGQRTKRQAAAAITSYKY